jgi:predicted AAA+ superfamily ATPase
MKEMGRKRGFILSKNEEEEIKIPEGTISVIPAWKWMLNPEMII